MNHYFGYPTRSRGIRREISRHTLAIFITLLLLCAVAVEALNNTTKESQCHDVTAACPRPTSTAPSSTLDGS